MREAILFAAAVSCFVGVAWRGVSQGDDAADAEAMARAEAQALVAGEKRDKAFATWSAGETVLPRAADGHFYADVTINGTSVNFLVDTGASMVALTGADARASGLHWDDAEVREVARGASGPVYGVPIVLDRVELDGHEATNVSGVIVPEGLGISLLGQSYLQTISPLRIESEEMILGG